MTAFRSPSYAVLALVCLAVPLINCDQSDPFARTAFGQSPAAPRPKADDENPGETSLGSATDMTTTIAVDPVVSADIRAKLLEIVDMYDNFAAANAMDRVQTQCQLARELLDQASDTDISVFATALPQITALRGLAVDLSTFLAPQPRSGRAPAFGAAAPPPVGGGSPLPDPRTHNCGTLPTANYSFLGENRTPTPVLFTLFELFAVAQAVRDAASRACDQVVVAAGFGSNTSLACIAADIILAIAQIAYENALFVVDDVDSAEIEGSYDRLEFIACLLTSCDPNSELRRGYGCNGIDDDCDVPPVIDECDEDVFAPDVFIDAAVILPWYRTTAEAIDAVALAVQAVDDCQQEVVISTPVLIGGDCDNVVISVTATDVCPNRPAGSMNNSRTVQTVVKVDGTPPSIVIDPLVEAMCFDSVAAAEQAVLAAATITDNCTAPGDLDTRIDSAVTECSLRVRIETIDLAGNRSTAAATVRVDVRPPSVEIRRLLLGFRGEVLGFQTPPCFASVADAEAAVLTNTRFSDNCTTTADLTTTATSAGDPCSLVVTVRAVDECGNDNTDAVTVRVDAEAPMVSCTTTVDVLSPDNHKMIDVGFSFTATDNCPGGPDVVIRVTSDEPTASASGAGQTSPSPDAEILRDLNGVVMGVRLRAERSSEGNGRVYQIHVIATDPCGNTATAQCSVSVPPNGNSQAIDDGQFYEATQVN